MTVWWIRRDLRLADNAALARARARGPVVPLFVIDPALVERIHGGAEKRLAFLWCGLARLDEALRARGARLVVRTGAPEAVVPAVVADAGGAGVVAEEDYSPYGRRRDAAVARAVPLELVPGLSVHHPRELRSGEGRPYTAFAPFGRAWMARPMPRRRDLAAPPGSFAPLPRGLASDPIPAAPAHPGFPAGEDEAHRRLAAFVRGARAPIRRYHEARDRLDLAATSGLSPYLRFGMLSARTAAVAAREAGAGRGTRAGAGADAWLSELVWREFYLAVLWHFPRVLRAARHPARRPIRWRHAPRELRAWQEGRTGYPVVDAAMRQLAAVGWIHNRARMIVASFLVKDLLVDWRLGEAWFMRHLVDGDPAANDGGWQWTAGTSPDAAPWFRIFNPVLQGKRYDPQGAYVRRWVPELSRVAPRAVHAPWEMSPREQAEAGCRIGRDYPLPMVDHAAARARALAAHAAARRTGKIARSPGAR